MSRLPALAPLTACCGALHVGFLLEATNTSGFRFYLAGVEGSNVAVRFSDLIGR